MCFGSKGNTDPPPVPPPTTFDYQSANRSPGGAYSTLPANQDATFGAELGSGGVVASGATPQTTTVAKRS